MFVAFTGVCPLCQYVGPIVSGSLGGLVSWFTDFPRYGLSVSLALSGAIVSVVALLRRVIRVGRSWHECCVCL